MANFVLIHFPAEGEKTAARADAFLSQSGVILRAVASYGLPNALRMTVGTEEQNRLAVSRCCSNSWRRDGTVQQDRHHRSGADRLLHRPCGAAAAGWPGKSPAMTPIPM